MKTMVFPFDRFCATFPVFAESPAVYSAEAIQLAGNEATHYIGNPERGMPLENIEDREYALFLMTAHILVLNKKLNEATADGETLQGGTPFKATIGSVSIENTKPNSFTSDDIDYWLNQTEYGRRLNVLLYEPMIFVNTCKDRVRVLK